MKQKLTEIIGQLWSGFQWLGVVILLIFAYKYFFGPSSSGLALGNLKAGNSVIKFDIANSSEKRGDVVVWVRQGDIERCVYKFPMHRTKIEGVNIQCEVDEDMNGGKYEISYIWADSDKSKALLARDASIPRDR